ncbi:MAG: radical SAM family heme chaperone HemW [Nitrospirales bacterium]|nr:radical SAM family heme chaperone HemW [Nitrospirales bacterium]
MVPTHTLNPSHSIYQIAHPSDSPLGLYLHVPFCLARCHFCSFYLQVYRTENVQKYVMALEGEIQLYADLLQLQATPIATIYFGGGTPTILTADQLSRIGNLIRSTYHVIPEAEITIEAHPASVTSSYLHQLLEAGFNRISFGIQSTSDSELIQLGGRNQTTQIAMAITQAQAAGFSNINIDVMYGLPGQTLETWTSTLHDILAFSPQHISCYALTIEEGTRFAIDQRRGKFKEHDGDIQVAMEEFACNAFTTAGYQHYELSNFSQPGFQCRHNMQYWQGGSYLGLGPSAQSCLGLTRFGNVADLDRYCEEIESQSLPIRNYELLEREQALRESIVLGLRMIQGVPLDLVNTIHACSDWQILVPQLIENGLLEQASGHLRLTTRGHRFADTVAVTLW